MHEIHSTSCHNVYASTTYSRQRAREVKSNAHLMNNLTFKLPNTKWKRSCKRDKKILLISGVERVKSIQYIWQMKMTNEEIIKMLG